MPMIEMVFAKALEAKLFTALKSVSPPPEGAGPEYTEAIQKMAKAIAESVAEMTIATVKTATIIAPPGTAGGPCVIA